MDVLGSKVVRRRRAARSGLTGADVFSAYASGIGILAAQAILVRFLEATPEVRAQIVERG